MKKRTLRPEELRIWAKVAATVTPGPGRRLPSLDEPRTAAGAAERPTIKRNTGPTPPHFVSKTNPAPPAERSGEKRVRRGRIDPAGRLDLHGMTQIQARAALARFLTRLREHGERCALVITGKGDPRARAYGQDAPGVLRRRLPEWLAEHDLAAIVTGFAPAHRRHGGDGAWYVFLRRRGE